MITNFKIFENADLNRYIDNFLIQKSGNTYSISMCIDIQITKNNKIFGVPKYTGLFVEFDCLDMNIEKSNCEAFGNHEILTKEEFSIFAKSFLTPIEFYNKYTDICTYFYEYIQNEFDNLKVPRDGGDGGWYPKFIKNFKRVLETIPEFEHFAAAEKYNL